MVNESGNKIPTNSEVISRLDETIFDKYTKSETEELLNNKIIYVISDKLPDTATINSNLLYFKRCSKYNNAQIVEMQSGDGLIYHPYTNSDAVIVGDNTLTDIISEIKIEEDKGIVSSVILLDNITDSLYDKYKKSFLVIIIHKQQL